MPTYSYRYINRDNEVKTIERRFRMREYPNTVQVKEGEVAYTASLIIEAPGKMATNWGRWNDGPSDLPPPSYPGIE
jgi:hypothetical protein